jgi:hypothetical protein
VYVLKVNGLAAEDEGGMRFGAGSSPHVAVMEFKTIRRIAKLVL